MLSRIFIKALCFGLATTIATSSYGTGDLVPSRHKIEPFELSQVRLLSSPFKEAQDKDIEYLLSVEPDRLLARFRENAGLVPRAKSYGGWEAQSIAGHSLGHYLSALSKGYASTGDERLKERATYITSELAQCQEAAKSGMLAGDSRYARVFEEISRGEIRSQGFDLNGLWVPWYVLHKLLAGLLDAYHYCDDQEALNTAKRLGDWGIGIIDNLSFEQMQKMLACEYGGTNEAYYSLYAATGNEKYLAAGDRFHDLAILQALEEGRDELQGRHANTQIPKIIGLARRHELTGEENDKAFLTAKFFWERVTDYHTYAIGGNSSGEHFGKPGVLSTRLTDTTCETCNTYNMLKLTQKLYMMTGDVAYINYFECALYNHILVSIDRSPDRDRLYTYFVPLISGGFRTYSTRENHWTCCHGTGMENHTQYNGEIYYHETLADGSEILYVNILIPSTLDWKEKGVTVILDSHGVLTVESQTDAKITVKVRIPNNCYADDDETRLEDSYYVFVKTESHAKVSQALPFFANWKLESTQDNPNVAAFFRGPILYSGDLGSIDVPLVSQLDAELNSAQGVVLPVVVSDQLDPNELVDDAGQGRRCSFFSTPERATLIKAKPHNVTLTPFYAAQERYCVYFDFFTNAAWSEKEKEYEAERARRLKLSQSTLQYFQPGEMQSERDVNFSGKNTANGEHMGRKWRDARDGSFEFDMKVDPEKPCSLVITYWGDETGNRKFDIIVDDQKLAERKLYRDHPGQFFDEAYPIPNPNKKQTVRVKFESKPGSTAGGIFGARTIYEEARAELFGN